MNVQSEKSEFLPGVQLTDLLNNLVTIRYDRRV